MVSGYRYHYDYCSKRIVTVTCKDQISCFCVPYSNIFGGSSIILSMVGIILNFLVLYQFSKKSHIRHKIPNIFLGHQAFVDSVSLVLFVLPRSISMIYLNIVENIPGHVYWGMTVWGTCSLVMISYISYLSFAVISGERWLAVWKPLWHRASVSRNSIFRSLSIVWMIAVSVTVTRLIYGVLEVNISEAFAKGNSYLGYVLITTMIALYLTTYIRVRMALKQRCQKQNQENKSILVKDLRLITIFCAMFVLFLLTFVPVVVSIQSYTHFAMTIQSEIQVLLFALSSTLSPLLTITLREEFKLKVCGDDSEASTNFTTMDTLDEAQSKTNPAYCDEEM